MPMLEQIELSLATAPFLPSSHVVELDGIETAFVKGKAAMAKLSAA